MGDSIKALFDDYSEYEYLCEKLGQEKMPMRGDSSWYTHMNEMFKQENVNGLIDYNRKQAGLDYFDYNRTHQKTELLDYSDDFDDEDDPNDLKQWK